jgi:hypothetical protein
MVENPEYTADDVMSYPWGTIDQKHEGTQALLDFAQKTYDALLAADRLQFKHEFLSMQLWCRLDIGVIKIPDSPELHFFVNEVEKFQSTCIWGRLGGPTHPLESLASESAAVLVQHMQQVYEVLD